jgi:diguanylate cyclase (GGDEF)-like protein
MTEEAILRRRFERERLARKEAENVAERKSRELYIKSLELESAVAAERCARQEVETLLHALESFTARLHTDGIIENLHHFVNTIVPNHGATLWLLNGEQFQAVSSKGEGLGDRSAGEAIASSEISVHLKDPNHPIIIKNAAKDERAQFFGIRAQSRSMIVLPLSVQSRIIGFMSLESREPDAFEERTASFTQALATEAAISLENARLFQEVERLSITDPLTGLNNRRFFDQAAETLFHLSIRSRHPLSALMVDIDYFKQVNDMYGHTVGDNVLVAVARACQQSVRSADLSSRYGGEEFCFLFSETSLKEALILANRLRASIAALEFQANGRRFSVTASFGISERLPDNDSLEGLLKRSDEALYQAKRAGRNCVAIWAPQADNRIISG